MKFKLKMICPFCGYGFRVFTVVMLVCIVPMVVHHSNLKLAVISTTIVAIIATAVGYLWCNRLNTVDLRAMEESELPLWTPVTAIDKGMVRTKMKFDKMIWLVIGTMFSAAAVMYVVFKNKTEFSYVKIFIAAIICGIVVASIFYLRSRLWNKIDNSALAAEIPVSSVYTVTNYGRYSSTTNTYMVIYLPDGKYVLPQKNICRKIRLIQFDGMLTYIEDYSFKD